MKKYIVLVLSIVIIVVSLFTIPGLKSWGGNPFQSTSLTTRTLEDLKTIKISQFNSAKYRYKSIFPYDFLYGDPVWNSLLIKSDKYMTPEDKYNREFYYQCREIGIDLNRNNYFLTITTVATAGINLDSYLKHSSLYVNESSGLIVLKTPNAEITSIAIEDNLKDGQYPEVELTPGEWQQLISLISPKIKNDIIATGLLSKSEEKNIKFIKQLYHSIGWEKVEFK